MDVLSNSGINNLVSNYRYDQINKRVSPLEARKTKFSNLSSTWGSLKSKLGSFKSLLTNFKNASLTTTFGLKQVALSNDEYFSATTNSTAALSTYNLRVNQLAQNDLAMSNTVTSATSAGISAGTHTIRVASGEFDENIDVELAGSETFEELMEIISEAINKASDGAVNASVFSPTSTQSKLSVVAGSSGSSSAITIEDVSGGVLSSIGMDFSSRTLLSGDSGGYSYSSDELDSKLSFNGIDVVRDSNTIDDLVSGVTLMLKQEMAEGVPTINVTISNDIKAIKTEIDGFIKKFNDVYTYVKENSKSNANGTRGLLVGNASSNNILQSFASIASQQVEGIEEGKLSFLSEIGLTFDSNGGLSVKDSKVLEEALKNSPSQVAALFNSENGIANKLYDSVDNYIGEDGLITDMINAYDKSVSYYTDKITFQETRIDKGAEVLRHQYESMQMQLASLYESQNYFNTMGIF